MKGGSLKEPRSEERFAADALASWLLMHGVTSAFMAVEHDPPDFCFTVELPGAIQQTWAVEVTGIFEYFEAGGSATTRLSFERRLHQTVKRMNADLTGQLQYEYFLNVDGPLDPKMLRSLEGRVLAYVESGKSEAEALDWPEALEAARATLKPEFRKDPNLQYIVDSRAQELVRVKIKAHTGTRGIVLGTAITPLAPIPGTNTPYSDVRANLDYAFTKVLDAKLPRMAKLREQYDRRVLVIWLGYLMWDFEDLYSAASNRVAPDALDGVFVVDHEQKVHPVVNHNLVPA